MRILIVESSKPLKEPPPTLFAFNVISDDAADNMELEEEDESVSSSPDPANFKGGSTVCPPTGRNLIPENPENVRLATASDCGNILY
jgi:hypothetical protein